MFVKSLLAGALALALNPPQDVTVQTSVTFTYHPLVEKVSCDEGSGTAFQIAPRKWLSVHHVTRHNGCKIDGQDVVVLSADEKNDFSILYVDDPRQGGIPVRCDGFHDGEWVFAIGHAGGHAIPQIMPLRYSETISESPVNAKKWAVLLWNRVIPGMSGGPVVDAWGRVVGTVNAYNIFYPISFSRSLSETELCKQ